MDYEKKYKEALEWARKVMQGKVGFVLDEVLEKFPELKENEDERVRKCIGDLIKENTFSNIYGVTKEQCLAWIEKQGEHANFRNKIQIGDKVTRNKDGVLVNLSQLNRVAKKGEQKSAWSEEDIVAIDCAVEILSKDLSSLAASIERLKSLKDKTQSQPKQEWSDDDGSMLYGVMETEEYMLDVVNGIKKFDVGNDDIRKACTEELDWLKSLEYRVQPQPQQEWSKEEKEKLNRIYSILGQAADTHAFSTTCRLIGDKECIELQDFLRDITKSQTNYYDKGFKDGASAIQFNKWTPSEEQMKALDIAIRCGIQLGPWEEESLKSLKEQLKKLKEIEL